jgi:hypothetical protein
MPGKRSKVTKKVGRSGKLHKTHIQNRDKTDKNAKYTDDAHNILSRLEYLIIMLIRMYIDIKHNIHNGKANKKAENNSLSQIES